MDISVKVIEYVPEPVVNEFTDLVTGLYNLPGDQAAEVGPFVASGDIDAETVATRALNKIQKAADDKHTIKKRAIKTEKDGVYLVLQAIPKITRTRTEKA